MRVYFTVILITMLSNMQAQNFTLIIGTYTNKCESEGIYVYDFDAQTAGFTLKSFSDKVVSPSYLTVSEDRNFIYSVNEDGDNSTVSAFYFKPDTGAIGFLGKQDAKGADPCYIIDDEYHVITANYSGGSIAVFEKNKFGSINEAKQVVQHNGSSINKERQEKAHVHMVHFTPDHKYVIANDLGTDKIYIYSYNPESEKEVLKLKSTVEVKKGSGPRHLVFSTDNKFAYLLHELDGTFTVLSYNDGVMKVVQETSIVADGFKGKVGAAEVRVSADGRFVYATNRGEANDISCFRIGSDGRLSFVGRTSTLGKGPRNFSIDPTGNYLLVAHQDTDNIVVFKRDIETGRLTDSGSRLILCSPVCLKFIEQ